MNLDGDPIRYPLISKEKKISRCSPLSLALANALADDDSFFLRADVIRPMKFYLNAGLHILAMSRRWLGAALAANGMSLKSPVLT